MNYSLSKHIMQLIIISIILIGCRNQENRNFQNLVIGSWAYMDSEGAYLEMYIDDKEILSQPEFGIYQGPFKYSIENNKIFFNNVSYHVEIIDCRSIRLINPSYNILLERFILDKSITKDEVDYGYFLRRCYFLVNKGVLSTQEAYDTLKKYNLYEFDKVVTEEIDIPTSADL